MSMHYPFKSLTLLFLVFCTFGLAQTKKAGPIIDTYGAVYTVENLDLEVPTDKMYRAVFEIARTPKEHDKINPSIETAARFLNMHAQNCVPLKQLKFALVVHGSASKDISSDETYLKRYGTTNPNRPLIEELIKAGGTIVLCGQSSSARKLPKEKLIEGVQLSLSAMTALIHFQDKDYRLIKF